MNINEPMTLATDYVLATASVFFSIQLFRLAAAKRGNAVKLWALGFAATAAAGIAGGTFHGFAHYFSSSVHRALWNITVYSIGLGSAFMISGAMASSLQWRGEATRWLIGGVIISLLGLGIQQSGMGFAENFNHNDLYHCIQIAALYLFYRGARLCGVSSI